MMQPNMIKSKARKHKFYKFIPNKKRQTLAKLASNNSVWNLIFTLFNLKKVYRTMIIKKLE